MEPQRDQRISGKALDLFSEGKHTMLIAPSTILLVLHSLFAVRVRLVFRFELEPVRYWSQEHLG